MTESQNTLLKEIFKSEKYQPFFFFLYTRKMKERWERNLTDWIASERFLFEEFPYPGNEQKSVASDDKSVKTTDPASKDSDHDLVRPTLKLMEKLASLYFTSGQEAIVGSAKSEMDQVAGELPAEDGEILFFTPNLCVFQKDEETERLYCIRWKIGGEAHREEMRSIEVLIRTIAKHFAANDFRFDVEELSIFHEMFRSLGISSCGIAYLKDCITDSAFQVFLTKEGELTTMEVNSFQDLVYDLELPLIPRRKLANLESRIFREAFEKFPESVQIILNNSSEKYDVLFYLSGKTFLLPKSGDPTIFAVGIEENSEMVRITMEHFLYEMLKFPEQRKFIPYFEGSGVEGAHFPAIGFVSTFRVFDRFEIFTRKNSESGFWKDAIKKAEIDALRRLANSVDERDFPILSAAHAHLGSPLLSDLEFGEKFERIRNLYFQSCAPTGVREAIRSYGLELKAQKMEHVSRLKQEIQEINLEIKELSVGLEDKRIRLADMNAPAKLIGKRHLYGNPYRSRRAGGGGSLVQMGVNMMYWHTEGKITDIRRKINYLRKLKIEKERELHVLTGRTIPLVETLDLTSYRGD